MVFIFEFLYLQNNYGHIYPLKKRIAWIQKNYGLDLRL